MRLLNLIKTCGEVTVHALNKGWKSQITYQPFLRALLLAYLLCSFFFSALYFVFAVHAEAQ